MGATNAYRAQIGLLRARADAAQRHVLDHTLVQEMDRLRDDVAHGRRPETSDGDAHPRRRNAQLPHERVVHSPISPVRLLRVSCFSSSRRVRVILVLGDLQGRRILVSSEHDHAYAAIRPILPPRVRSKVERRPLFSGGLRSHLVWRSDHGDNLIRGHSFIYRREEARLLVCRQAAMLLGPACGFRRSFLSYAVLLRSDQPATRAQLRDRQLLIEKRELGLEVEAVA